MSTGRVLVLTECTAQEAAAKAEATFKRLQRKLAEAEAILKSMQLQDIANQLTVIEAAIVAIKDIMLLVASRAQAAAEQAKAFGRARTSDAAEEARLAAECEAEWAELLANNAEAQFEKIRQLASVANNNSSAATILAALGQVLVHGENVTPSAASTHPAVDRPQTGMQVASRSPSPVSPSSSVEEASLQLLRQCY